MPTPPAVTAADYDSRLNRVTAHVYEHLEDELDLLTLADIACLSPYHWHRIYHARRGETIAATVRRLRLERAAALLSQTSTGIAEIAERCRYGSVAAFTRAFERSYGMPPARYRQYGSHSQFDAPVTPITGTPHAVRIEKRSSLTAVTLPHRGAYLDIGRSFDALFGWLTARDLMRPGLRSVALYYDDPALVAEPDLEARAGVIPSEPFEVEWPLELTDIAARDYAVLRHIGPYADMKAAYQWLYGEWLPGSGRWVADEPVFEEYLNDPRTAPATALETLIYLPLAPDANSSSG